MENIVILVKRVIYWDYFEFGGKQVLKASSGKCALMHGHPGGRGRVL
jgi:hypothetical protein